MSATLHLRMTLGVLALAWLLLYRCTWGCVDSVRGQPRVAVRATACRLRRLLLRLPWWPDGQRYEGKRVPLPRTHTRTPPPTSLTTRENILKLTLTSAVLFHFSFIFSLFISSFLHFSFYSCFSNFFIFFIFHFASFFSSVFVFYLFRFFHLFEKSWQKSVLVVVHQVIREMRNMEAWRCQSPSRFGRPRGASRRTLTP